MKTYCFVIVAFLCVACVRPALIIPDTLETHLRYSSSYHHYVKLVNRDLDFEENHSFRPEHPEVDSALIMTFFADSMVIWYFRLSQYDTIYIIRNHFTENVTITHHEEDEKTIVFVSREMAPPTFVSGRRLNLVLEVLGFGWEGRNKVRLSIGRDTENQATIRAVRKRGRWRVYGGGIS